MKRSFLLIAFFTAFFFSCAEDDSPKEDVVTIHTQHGDMVLVLFDETPKHKENFLKLVNEKYYENTLFHRVIRGFMIQGGDPDSRNAQPGQMLGMGGPKYTIPAEFNPAFFHEKGALAAARTGDQANPKKESSGSQFYIVHGNVLNEVQLQQYKVKPEKMNQALTQMFQSGKYKPLFDSMEVLQRTADMETFNKAVENLIPRIEKETGINVSRTLTPEMIKVYTTIGGSPELDTEYTVFGKVIKGLEVIDKIAAVGTDGNNRPVEDVKMSMTVEKMSRKKIEKEYGYTFPTPKKG